jgi:predicted transcriptional regulator
MPNNKGNNRDRIQIVADILYNTRHGAKKSHILYKCGLSSVQLDFYLPLTLSANLMEKIKGQDGKDIYRRTDKGQDLLIAKEIIDKLMRPDNDPMPNGSNAPYVDVPNSLHNNGKNNAHLRI